MARRIRPGTDRSFAQFCAEARRAALAGGLTLTPTCPWCGVRLDLRGLSATAQRLAWARHQPARTYQYRGWSVVQPSCAAAAPGRLAFVGSRRPRRHQEASA